jgi:hypothetical protein
LAKTEGGARRQFLALRVRIQAARVLVDLEGRSDDNFLSLRFFARIQTDGDAMTTPHQPTAFARRGEARPGLAF